VTVRKGHDWGEVTTFPPGVEVVQDGRELFEWLNGDRRGPAVGVTGRGDLTRTLGTAKDGAAVLERGTTVVRVCVDVGLADHDGGMHRFASHAVARRAGPLGWWRGPILGAFNAQYHGRWDVAARAHPNDGRLDIVEVAASMPLRQRWLGRRRLPTGQHVPHPDVKTRSTTGESWEFGEALALYLDGIPVGTTGRLRVTVDPDALVVYS
jgi:hypothetical protein